VAPVDQRDNRDVRRLVGSIRPAETDYTNVPDGFLAAIPQS